MIPGVLAAVMVGGLFLLWEGSGVTGGLYRARWLRITGAVIALMAVVVFVIYLEVI